MSKITCRRTRCARTCWRSCSNVYVKGVAVVGADQRHKPGKLQQKDKLVVFCTEFMIVCALVRDRESGRVRVSEREWERVREREWEREREREWERESE